MVSYQVELPQGSVKISLEVDDPTTPVEINYSGDSQAIALIWECLHFSYGLYGHLIGDRCNAIDLSVAMKSMSSFNPILVAGGEILEAYTPESFPEGVVS